MSESIATIVLGFIEGVTEFLPVSSTGHLLLAEHFFKGLVGSTRRSDIFNTVIQCGAILAVLFNRHTRQLVWKDGRPTARGFLVKLLVALAVTSFGWVVLHTLIKLMGGLSEVKWVGWATLIGGVVILVVERLVRGKARRTDITWTMVVVVGLAQSLAAAFPGTSRSGATILAAICLGASRTSAAEFSFLLGLPTLFVAGGFQFVHAYYKAHQQGIPVTEDWGQLLLGSLAALITACLVVKLFLRFVQNHTLAVFGWYRIALGILVVVLLC